MQGSSWRASLLATSPIGPSTRWKRISSRRSVKMRLISSRPRKLSIALLLHRQHLLLDRLDHRQIAVDDEIEDRVEDIIDAVHEQEGAASSWSRSARVGAGGDVADA